MSDYIDLLPLVVSIAEKSLTDKLALDKRVGLVRNDTLERAEAGDTINIPLWLPGEEGHTGRLSPVTLRHAEVTFAIWRYDIESIGKYVAPAVSVIAEHINAGLDAAGDGLVPGEKLALVTRRLPLPFPFSGANGAYGAARGFVFRVVHDCQNNTMNQNFILDCLWGAGKLKAPRIEATLANYAR